MLQLVLTSYK